LLLALNAGDQGASRFDFARSKVASPSRCLLNIGKAAAVWHWLLRARAGNDEESVDEL
jgi:hypothetical protein